MSKRNLSAAGNIINSSLVTSGIKFPTIELIEHDEKFLIEIEVIIHSIISFYAYPNHSTTFNIG